MAAILPKSEFSAKVGDSRSESESNSVTRQRKLDSSIDLECAVRDHYKQVYRFAFHLSRHKEDAADLTQYAYEKLVQKHKDIEDPAKVRSWLQSIVYRKFIDQKRQIIRFPQVEFNEANQDHAMIENDAGKRLDSQTALEAVHKLEDDLRAPLLLYYLESISYKEIARLLSLPAGTVMSRLYRGKAKLYNMLSGVSNEH